jgi:hypothetical protein
MTPIMIDYRGHRPDHRPRDPEGLPGTRQTTPLGDPSLTLLKIMKGVCLGCTPNGRCDQDSCVARIVDHVVFRTRVHGCPKSSALVAD